MVGERLKFGELEESLHRARDLFDYFDAEASERFEHRILEEASRVDVVSFDVFDTILIRNTKSELEKFHDVAVRFYDTLPGDAKTNLTARTCLLARLQAASIAYRCSERVDGCVEGRMDDIARATIRYLKLDGTFADQWTEAELDVETEHLTALPVAKSLISKLKMQGKTLICISDMYLNVEQIRFLMRAAGYTVSDFDEVFSSADLVLNKRTGRDREARRYGCPADREQKRPHG